MSNKSPDPTAQKTNQSVDEARYDSASNNGPNSRRIAPPQGTGWPPTENSEGNPSSMNSSGYGAAQQQPSAQHLQFSVAQPINPSPYWIPASNGRYPMGLAPQPGQLPPHSIYQLPAHLPTHPQASHFAYPMHQMPSQIPSNVQPLPTHLKLGQEWPPAGEAQSQALVAAIMAKQQIQQPNNLDSAQSNPSTSHVTNSSIPAPSPSASSSAADDNTNGSSAFHSPSYPPNPASRNQTMTPQQQPSPMPSNVPPDSLSAQRAAAYVAQQRLQIQQQNQQINELITAAQRDAIDKLVGVPNAEVPPNMITPRRNFFERLVLLNEKNGENLSAPPQVAKTSVDLFKLHQAVTNNKSWKNLCGEANAAIQESSAAGYQLRRCYQKYLLVLECQETGQNPQDLLILAEKSKKSKYKKKDKEEKASTSKAAKRALEMENKNTTPSTSVSTTVSSTTTQLQSQPGVTAPPHSGFPHIPGVTPANASTGSTEFNQAYYYPVPPQTSNANPWGAPPNNYPYHPGIRFPPNIRAPTLEGLSEEQQRQQFYQHQQQAAYAVHMQQQAAMAAQQQTNSQAASNSLLQPNMPASNELNRASCSSTPVPVSLSHSQPASAAGAGNGQVNSRAPSTGPPVPISTPDSTSRMSANEENSGQTTISTSQQASTPRPPSQQAQPQQQRHTPTPTYSYTQANAPTPPLTTSVPPIINQLAAPFYHQPLTYGMRPPPPQLGQIPGSIKTGYPVYPSNPTEIYPSGMYSQQAMWALPPGAHPRFAPPPEQYMGVSGQIKSNASSTNTAHQVQLQQQASMLEAQRRVAAAQGSSGQTLPPQNMYYQPPQGPYSVVSNPGATSTHSPNIQRNRYPNNSQLRPQMHPLSSAGPAYFQSLGPLPTTSQQQNTFPGISSVYPSDSVEGITQNNTLLKRKRPKIYARDLTLCTPKRILMALRSGLVTETIWAINVMNVLLYDDSAISSNILNNFINLNIIPELLNLVVEHFISCLVILYPKLANYKGIISRIQQTENINKFLFTHQELGSSRDFSIKALVKPPMGRQSIKTLPNYTKITRTGRPVGEDKQEISMKLKKLLPFGTIPETTGRENSDNKILGIASRIKESLENSINFSKSLTKSKFNKNFDTSPKWDISEKELEENANTDDDEKEKEIPFFYRISKDSEKWDRIAQQNSSLLARPIALCNQDENLEDLASRALALSNIIRGFSFLHGNEKVLGKHTGLLQIIGCLLKLLADEKPAKIDAKSAECIVPNSKVDVVECQDKSNIENKKATKLNVDVSEYFKPKVNLDVKPYVKPAEDSTERLLLETANHLREDAFVLNIYDLDSEISWNIFDALLNWCVSTNLQAKDPLLPGVLSPRSYSLEILCKLSVIDYNLDLLISTGPWPRCEEFIRVLCSLINLNEEVPYREFAIVILNKITNISEAACYVAAKETTVINQLITFIEFADQNMEHFVQQNGMQALRENSEVMGTSVAMLRRAALIILNLSRHVYCHKPLLKVQKRMLAFTMDTKVANFITDALYELRRSDINKLAGTEVYSKPVTPKFLSVLNEELLEDAKKNVDEDVIKMVPKIEILKNGEYSIINSKETCDDNFLGVKETRKRKASGGSESNGLYNSKNNNNYRNTSTSNGDSFIHNNTEQQTSPRLLTASDAVKERLRNNILSHSPDALLTKRAHLDMPKSPKNQVNGGLLNGKKVDAQDENDFNNHKKNITKNNGDDSEIVESLTEQKASNNKVAVPNSSNTTTTTNKSNSSSSSMTMVA